MTPPYAFVAQKYAICIRIFMYDKQTTLNQKCKKKTKRQSFCLTCEI